ncbi:MAG: hypothetical protein WBI04_06420 [Trichlorobacter sp.]
MKNTLVKWYLILLLCLICGVEAGAEATQSLPLLSKSESGTLQSTHEKGLAFTQKASAQYDLGRISTSVRERADHFRRAEEFAQQAIKVEPQSDEGYKWLAISLGAQAEDVNVRTQIQLSRRVKEAIEKALSLDPNDDISLLVLSRWHYKIASLQPWTRAFVKLVYGGLPQASLEQAAELQLRAIAKKDRIAHRYSLAKIYYQMGRRDAALEQLRRAIALPVTFPEEADDIEKARRKLGRWK